MNAQTLDFTLQHELPAAARGDQHAYGRIVRACQNTVTAIALAITRDVTASEDIAQEAFLKAWQQLDRLSNAASFLPWLRQITRNLARDHLRANRNRALTGERAEIAIGMAADPSPTPGQRLLQTEEESAAEEIISALPEDSRETLLLYYREGQSSQQVAILLGLSDAAVRKRLSRARSSVREDMLRRFGEFASASAPGAAFASSMLGVLAMTAPPAAGASVLGTGSVLTGQGVLKLLGAAAGAIAIGLMVGIGSIWLSIRRQLRDPLDQIERRQLLQYGAVNTVLMVAFMAGIIALSQVPGWIPHLLVSVGYMIGISVTSAIWLPRILARRQQRDLQRDPIGMRRNMERARFWRVVGPVAGIVLATAGLVTGLVWSGRISL